MANDVAGFLGELGKISQAAACALNNAFPAPSSVLQKLGFGDGAGALASQCYAISRSKEGNFDKALQGTPAPAGSIPAPQGLQLTPSGQTPQAVTKNWAGVIEPPSPFKRS